MGQVFACRQKPRLSNSSKQNTKPDKRVYALKELSFDKIKSKARLKELQMEVEAMKSLDNPFIVKAYESFEGHGKIFVIMEFCSGGDLYSRQPYTEKQASAIAGQVLNAISYMHEHNIIHRDLKFENIMFEDTTEYSTIKIIDFGLSKPFSNNNEFMKGFAGTIYTMAPEILEGEKYTSKADLWSVGVITYMLLSGSRPFKANNLNYSETVRRDIVIDKIRASYVFFDEEIWDNLTPDAKHFVSSLLQKDYTKRLSAREALKSKWIDANIFHTNETTDKDLFLKVSQGLQNYAKTSSMKKLGLLVSAYYSSPTDEIRRLRSIFNNIDVDHNGYITKEEFAEALKEFYSTEQVNNLFNSLDVEADGIIHYTEFLASTLEVVEELGEQRLIQAFDTLDNDHSGFISKKNLKHVLGKKYSEEIAQKYFLGADLDGDGLVSLEEFKSLFRKDVANKNNKVQEYSFNKVEHDSTES